MGISLKDLKKTTAKPNPFIYLYGVAGVGKDTLAAEFPAPILIQTPGEEPPSDVSIPSFGEISTFDGLMDAIESLFTEDHEFKTLIISAAGGVERMVQAQTCSEEGVRSIEDVGGGFGKGYVAADVVWQRFLSAVSGLGKAKGMSVVLIGHTEIKNFDDPASSSYSRYQPNLHKRAAEAVLPATDIIAFVNHRVSIKTEKGAFGKETKEANGSGTRMIYLEERPGFIAKNRYNMPPELRFDKGKGFEAIAKYLPKVEGK